MERLDVQPETPWWGEHRSRYRLASSYARGSLVLDIACGSGFGVAMLAEAGARSVIGADLAANALAQAKRAFAGRRRSFLTASGTRLPFADSSFGLITSFETLEHIPAAEAFLAELRRVLDPGGLLVLSTPNRDYTELNGQRCTNPFHVREYTRPELAERLSRYFAQVELLGQRLSPVYRISPFHADHVRLYLTRAMRHRLIWWKLQNRLPFPIKDALSRTLRGRPFYPGEEHYMFAHDGIEVAPVLVALCRP